MWKWNKYGDLYIILSYMLSSTGLCFILVVINPQSESLGYLLQLVLPDL